MGLSSAAPPKVSVEAIALIPSTLAAAGACLLLFGRLFETYAPYWIIGGISTVYLAVAGSKTERSVLVGMFLLALLTSGEQAHIGLRSCVFLSMLMVFARHTTLNPYLHLLLQLLLLASTTVYGIQGLEAFAFGPSMLFLIIAALHDSRYGKSYLRLACLSILSLLTASLGFGSRSALFVWILALARKHVLAFAAIAAAAIPVALAVPNLPIASKLVNSVTEVTDITQDSGAINQRGIESLIFVDYLSSATITELTLGSRSSIFLPGELIGNSDDPIYVPHNQLLGLFFQFGTVGIALLAAYFYSLFKWHSTCSDSVFFMLALLPPFLLFKHGFLDADLALLLSTLNWLRQHQEGKA